MDSPEKRRFYPFRNNIVDSCTPLRTGFLLNNKCDTFLKKSSYATLGNEKYMKTGGFYSHTENRLQAIVWWTLFTKYRRS